MKSCGEINAISEKFGGPNPTQELVGSKFEDEWIEEAFVGGDDD